MEKLKFSYINSDKEKIIEKELENVLKIIGKSFFFENISFIIKEMVNNANKANLKEAYFRLNNININSKEEYLLNLPAFKKAITENIELFYDQINRLGLSIEISFSLEHNHLIITVINNRPLLPYEKEKIEERFEKAENYKLLDNNLISSVDHSEGAGLGIILIILMLKKMGLDSSYFKIYEFGNKTVSKLLIPLTILEEKEQVVIAEIVEKEIDTIPKIPESITKLELKIDDPNSSFMDIAMIVKEDPSLIAEVLKIANSGFYLIMNKVKTVEEAVRVVGFEGIKSMIMLHKIKELLLKKYNIEQVKKEITHSTEVALIACALAKTYNYKNEIPEVYTASSLHDIGKIVINAINPELIEKISFICKSKGINVNIVENFTEGFNHSLVGAQLAQKWNFSDNIVTVIKYHHSPESIHGELGDLVKLVYMANTLYYYKRNQFLFTNINASVLNHFNIKNETELKELNKKIESLLTSI